MPNDFACDEDDKFVTTAIRLAYGISAVTVILLILLAIDTLDTSHPIYHLIYG